MKSSGFVQSRNFRFLAGALEAHAALATSAAGSRPRPDSTGRTNIAICRKALARGMAASEPQAGIPCGTPAWLIRAAAGCILPSPPASPKGPAPPGERPTEKANIFPLTFRSGALFGSRKPGAVTIAHLFGSPIRGILSLGKNMLLILCFLYCFFAIVLGIYLGFELLSVRKTERMARTMLKGMVQSSRAQAAATAAEAAGSPTAPTNYFEVK